MACFARFFCRFVWCRKFFREMFNPPPQKKSGPPPPTHTLVSVTALTFNQIILFGVSFHASRWYDLSGSNHFCYLLTRRLFQKVNRPMFKWNRYSHVVYFWVMEWNITLNLSLKSLAFRYKPTVPYCVLRAPSCRVCRKFNSWAAFSRMCKWTGKK